MEITIDESIVLFHALDEIWLKRPLNEREARLHTKLNLIIIDAALSDNK